MLSYIISSEAHKNIIAHNHYGQDIDVEHTGAQYQGAVPMEVE